MSKPLTKEDFQIFSRAINRRFEAMGRRFESQFIFFTKEIISHFNKSQGEQNKRFDGIDERLSGTDVKLPAVMDMLATRSEVRNLVRELKMQKIMLDESKIFTT